MRADIVPGGIFPDGRAYLIMPKRDANSASYKGLIL